MTYNNSDLSYTQKLSFSPISKGRYAGLWKSNQRYAFFWEKENSGSKISGPVIIVARNYRSNGADVPPPWSIFTISLILTSLIGWLLLPLTQNAPFTFMTAIWVSVSLALTSGWLLPRVHAEYIEAVFVHDIGLDTHRHLSRKTIDLMFLKALKVTTSQRLDQYFESGFLKRKVFWRRIRPYVIYFSVALFGLIVEKQKYFKPLKPKP